MPGRFLTRKLALVICSFLLVFWNSAAFGDEDRLLRVRLTSAFPAALQVSGDTSVLSLTIAGGWQTVDNLTLTKDRRWNIAWDKDAGRLTLSSDDGKSFSSDRPIRLVPETSEGVFQIFGRYYPGTLEFFPGKNGLEAYNKVGIEEYVKGVLAGESIPGWQIEALKAQAVAARTFALCQLGRHGDYDFCDQPHCQRYLGVTQEPSFIRAVDETKGQVLTFNNKLIWAFYHASSGGQTENNEDVWGGAPLPYLRSVKDYDETCVKCDWPTPYLMTAGEFLARLGFVNWPSCEIRPVFSAQGGNPVAYTFQRPGDLKPQRLTREEIRWKLGFPSPRFQIRRINGEEIRQALTQIDGGTVRVLQGVPEGEQIRLTIRLDVDIPGEVLNGPATLLPSEILFITGKGSGHGVGLSQWGSQGMALLGKNYQEILHHYYGDGVVITQYN